MNKNLFIEKARYRTEIHRDKIRGHVTDHIMEPSRRIMG